MISPYSGQCVSRSGGGDFGVFLPDADKQESEQIAGTLAERLEGLSVEELSVSDDMFSIGGVSYNTPCSFSHLLAKADTALIAARHAGPNCWEIEPAFCDDDDPTQGKVWWRNTLAQSLNDRALNLYGQYVRTGCRAGGIDAHGSCSPASPSMTAGKWLPASSFPWPSVPR